MSLTTHSISDHFFGLLPNVTLDTLVTETLKTLFMAGTSALVAGVIGMILGVLLFLTSPGQALARPWLYRPLVFIVNTLRAIPFIILIVLLLPASKLLVGTTLGPAAVLPALMVGASPFYARLVEIALREVDLGVLEAAASMGCKLRHIIFKILLPEASPALVSGMTVTTIAIVGYTAMAGFVGGGGLGNLAYDYGHQRNMRDYIWCATLLILIIVTLIQWVGDSIARRLDKR